MKYALSLAGLVLISAVPASAEVVFSQRPTSDPDSVGYGFYSHSHSTTTHNFKHADGFTLDSDTMLSGVRWWGNSSGDASPNLGNVFAFTVEIFTGAFVPDELIYTETFLLDDTNPFNTGRFGQQNSWEYRHDVTFAETVSVSAGTGYMISVSATLASPFNPDRWSWEDADPNDEVAATYSWASGTWSVQHGYDSAFELHAIPGPGGVACAMVFALRRSRRRRV